MSQGDPGPSDRTAYWFKRRRYGWGFTPVSWQGWASVVVMILLVIVPAFWLTDDGPRAVLYLAYVALVVAIFIGLAVRTGPRPRWRWGTTESDDPAEDF